MTKTSCKNKTKKNKGKTNVQNTEWKYKRRILTKWIKTKTEVTVLYVAARTAGDVRRQDRGTFNAASMGKHFPTFRTTVINIIIIIIIIIIIGSTALGGPWPPQANVASDPFPGHQPANFYNPVSLRLPLPRQSIWISVGHVLVDVQVLSIISFYVIRSYPFESQDSSGFTFRSSTPMSWNEDNTAHYLPQWHCVTSQKTQVFSNTAVRTSNGRNFAYSNDRRLRCLAGRHFQ